MSVSKMMIVVRRDLKMRKGKIAAQAGHACVEAILMALKKEERLQDVEFAGDYIDLKVPEDAEKTPLTEWFRCGVAKVCVYVDSEEELLNIQKKALEKGVLCALICDAGVTEFHGEPTYTCLALEPLYNDVANEITGELPLY